MSYMYKCVVKSAGPARWSVSVPELPGVVAFGATPIKALEAAAAANERPQMMSTSLPDQSPRLVPAA